MTLKILSLLCCGLFFVVIASKAQQSTLEIGFEGGVSSIYHTSGPHHSESEGTHQAKTVGFAGVRLQFELRGGFSFRSGMIRERKGGIVEYVIRSQHNPKRVGEIGTTEIYFDYLTLPLMMKYHFWERVPLYVTLGPYAGFLLEEYYIDEDMFKVDRAALNFEGQTMTFGGLGGLGVDLPVTDRLTINMEVSHKLSLTDPEKYSDIKLHTNSLSIGILYEFE